MPLTFPTSPTNGQTVTLSGTTYTYNTTKGVWEATASGGGSGFDASAFDSHILPDTNETYDIGSASKKIRDLYLSDSTLNIGTQSISANSDGIVLPAVTIGTGTNKVILSATASGGLKQAGTNSAGVAAPESTGGGVGESAPGAAASYEDMAGLIAATGMTTGQTALVTSLNRLFMYTGTGWFKIADMSNASPTDITGVEGTYALALDGTATVVTVASTDPEGFPLTFSHTVTSGSLGSIATVVQGTGANTNVFTITPSTDEANEGTFSLTFSVTDGTTGAVNAVSAFTLAFYTFTKPILNTEYTHVLANPSIYAQTDNDIEFTMPSRGGGWYQGRTFVASLKIPINAGTGKIYFELVCSNGGGSSANTMWTFSKSNWSTTPAANGGANDDHGWVYTTGYYYPTAGAPTITNAYTDFATNAVGLNGGTGAGADRVGIAYDPSGNNLKGEWWMRKGQDLWAWGNPITAGSGYRSTHAATVANAHTYLYFWITDGTGGDVPSRRVKFFGKPLHLYTTPSGYTAMQKFYKKQN